MRTRANPFVVREGLPFLAACVLIAVGIWQWSEPVYLWLPAVVFLWLLLVFRDPLRKTPAVPLGVVSPVDGKVVEVSVTDKSALNGEAHRIFIRVNSFGTYTARCPVEGKIRDIRTAVPESEAENGFSGLWVSTDEGDDVVLQFRGHRFGLAPLAFLRYGERVGQGQRCAYLRLTRLAEVQLPVNGRVLVKKGQRIAAGVDLLAKLPHH